MENSSIFVPRQDSGFMTLTLSLGKPVWEDGSATVESLVTNRKTTLPDRLISCEQNTQSTKSSKTSDPVSTSNEKDLKPYWNQPIAEISKKLWLPIKTALADLGMNLFDGFIGVRDFYV